MFEPAFVHAPSYCVNNDMSFYDALSRLGVGAEKQTLYDSGTGNKMKQGLLIRSCRGDKGGSSILGSANSSG
jgi:hypothetical protein